MCHGEAITPLFVLVLIRLVKCSQAWPEYTAASCPCNSCTACSRQRACSDHRYCSDKCAIISKVAIKSRRTNSYPLLCHSGCFGSVKHRLSTHCSAKSQVADWTNAWGSEEKLEAHIFHLLIWTPPFRLGSVNGRQQQCVCMCVCV